MTELKHTLEEEDQRNTECCDSECGDICGQHNVFAGGCTTHSASSLARTTNYKMPPEAQLDKKRSLNSLKIKGCSFVREQRNQMGQIPVKLLWDSLPPGLKIVLKQV